MIYIAVLLYLIYLIYRYDYREISSGQKGHYYFLMTVFICIAGLSYRLGGDTIMYERYFYDYTGPNGFSGLFADDMFITTREPLWVLLNSTVLSLFNDFQFLKFIISVFVNGTIFWFIKKHSKVPFTTILLYAVFAFFSYNFQILRESLAISFFLIGFDRFVCSEKRKYIKYLIWIVPAVLCHHMAFIAVAYPLFSYIRGGKKFYVILAVIAGLSSIINILFGEMLSSLAFVEDISDVAEYYYEHEYYGESTASGFSIIGTIAWLVLDIIPILIFVSKSNESICKSVGLAYIIIIVLKTTSISILLRIAGFIFIPAALSISEGISNTIYATNANIKKASVIFVLILFVMIGEKIRITYLSPQFDEYYPYSSVIFKNTDAAREQKYQSF